ncbi:MAG: RNA chaperone Hfq [Firmicutes bacterium]|nr:RNA chaperone Hfq [Bacillota bacterium]
MEKPGLQELFLNSLRKENIPATFFLVNGFQMKGILTAFDSFTILVRCGEEQNMIFKHAVSTIIPQAPIDLSPLYGEFA